MRSRLFYKLPAALLIITGLSAPLTACARGDAPPSPQNGAQLFSDNCAGCHMPGNAALPDLTARLRAGELSNGHFISAVREGIAETDMPAFGEALSAQDIRDIQAYLKTDRALIPTAAISKVDKVDTALSIETWVDGLDEPWGIVFTGKKTALITEKKGQLRQVIDGALSPEPVTNTPEVFTDGQGGLMDVALDPNYRENGWVYLSFSHPRPENPELAMTKIIRGQVKNGAWTNPQTLFEAHVEDYVKSRYHFGSRITFDGQGHLFFSVGDRGQKDQAQDLTKPNGKIHRIKTDGLIPDDNPFLNIAGAYPSIYAYGNRNPQGLIYAPQSRQLWETEHGPKGGDELNRIQAGKNYGWPVISYGRNYNGTELTPYTVKPGMEQPASQWTPSIAVCGLDIYSGDMFPEWQGRLMAGSLRNQSLRLIDVTGGEYKSERILLKDKGRIRDITTGPDGAIYAALPEAIIKVSK